jgi:hypothetical protein
MKKYSKSFVINVLSLSTGKTYTADSMKVVCEKIGISFETLNKIRRGVRTSFYTNTSGKTYQIKFIADKACTLYPAWDTTYDVEPCLEKVCASHTEAINFLSGGGPSKKSSYNRRMNMQPVDVPCRLPITDNFGREWIITFHKEKGEFIPNKKRE